MQRTWSIVEDIFGQSGLIYCNTTDPYELLCNKCTTKWNDLDGVEKKNLLFSQYIETYKKMHSVRLFLSKEYGFGSQLVTANPIESVNAGTIYLSRTCLPFWMILNH